MPITEKLFDLDAFATRFDAEVLSCEPLPPTKNRFGQVYRYAVLLDRTLFFPEMGGQYADGGVLHQGETEVRVLDTVMQNGAILHMVASPLSLGTVSGEIDFESRFDRMQQHSGEHLLSGTVYRLYGFHNVGFHLGDDGMTVDFDGILSREDLCRVEETVNRVIWRDLPIRTWYPDKEELASLDYRSKKELTGDVRLVGIEGVDLCACCAPHVRTTGQVGLCKILSCIRNKGGVRLEIACGARAVKELTLAYDTLNAAAESLSTGRDRFAAAFEKMKTEDGETRLALGNLSRAYAEKIAETAAPAPILFAFTANLLGADRARELANLLACRASFAAVTFSGEDNALSYTVVSQTGRAKEFADAMNAAMNGRGGGNGEMVRGRLQATETDVRAWLEARQEDEK